MSITDHRNRPAATAELWVNTRTRVTPYTARVDAAGVQAYSVYNHMLLPLMFRSVADDYWHLKQHVQLWDVSAQRQVELNGPDAAWLMQYMTPRDISNATVGRCLYTPIVDRRGGLVNDPVVLKLAEDRFWISIGDSDVGLWADGLATGLNLDVQVFEPDVSPLAVQGPKAEELMARVFGESVRTIKFFRFEELPFQGRSLRVARTGWSKQGGFEIYLDDSSLGERLWDVLWQAGSDLDVGPGCPNVVERIEGGLLSYGADMTRANNPYECGFDSFVQLDRPIEVLSRPALERLRATGPCRRIMGVRLDSDALPACIRPWPVIAAGRRIGQITSAAMSPLRGAGVAIGMVDQTHWDPGTMVTVETPDGMRTASICALPFS